MNKWVEKSIKLANSKGYLDNLFKVYPTDLGVNRVLSDDLFDKFKKDFNKKNKKEFIEDLLKFPKFPIDDPYIASLRRHSFLFGKNPKTIDRIGKRILAMDLDIILKLSTVPQKPSRQLGHVFHDWLKKEKFKFLDENRFKIYKGTAFLTGGDKALKDFAVKELKVKGLKKGLDFVLKIKDRYIIGEAKFLTDYGGTQNNQFRDAISVAKIKNDNVFGVAVLDGIVWFKSNAYMHKAAKSLKGVALSSLLLKKFIKEQI
ncbi:MAG: hypothetical protein AAB516_00020 [Patescibacteria group bacterium]